jgi:hypothetical protein
MGQDREELFSLGEVFPVMEQVLFRFANMLAVVAEELNFWKRKFPVYVDNALTFQSMVVGTWRLITHIHCKLERQRNGEEKGQSFSIASCFTTVSGCGVVVPIGCLLLTRFSI